MLLGSIVQWRAETTVFNSSILQPINAGDNKLNPGRKKKEISLSFCHFQQYYCSFFSKLRLSETYNMKQNFDIICLPETYLDSPFKMTIKDHI